MSEKAQIVLADDDVGFVKALTVRLEQEGYKVFAAPDGYFALAEAVEHKPDLLILDIHMPAGDGFTVQQRKDKMSPLADVPVIYVTGDKSDQTRLRAESSGAMLVHKPFELQELLTAIEQTLASRAA